MSFGIRRYQDEDEDEYEDEDATTPNHISISQSIHIPQRHTIHDTRPPPRPRPRPRGVIPSCRFASVDVLLPL